MHITVVLTPNACVASTIFSNLKMDAHKLMTKKETQYYFT